MIDFRALIDTNEVYKDMDTRKEYALLQKPYLSPSFAEDEVYEAAAISEDGEEVMLRWHCINGEPDDCSNDWDNFEVILC